MSGHKSKPFLFLQVGKIRKFETEQLSQSQLDGNVVAVSLISSPGHTFIPKESTYICLKLNTNWTRILTSSGLCYVLLHSLVESFQSFSPLTTARVTEVWLGVAPAHRSTCTKIKSHNIMIMYLL